MLRYFATAVRMTIASVALLGLIYPLTMTGLAEAIFPTQADGSFVMARGRIAGSWIVGQAWTSPRYFSGRPSAAGKGYDPTATGGTNLGPTSDKLIGAVRQTIARLERANPDAPGPPPIDLVTSSGSGIDPDITPEAAYWQAPRGARARRQALAGVRETIASQVRTREFGILGEPRVNVFELNLALDLTHG